jgi:MFS transporter, AAHS family, 3-hydroxyphenylpropionic acid transporter
MTTKSITASSRLTLALCSLAALSEGFDNQSMGVAAPKLVPQFALSTGQASVIFSAATLGLFLGAAVGGRIADRAGRRNMLAVSLFLFGVCSLLTSAAVGPNSLFLARLLTGFGLGGALPNFIALASEATRASERVSSVTVIMAGMPFGGFLAGLVALGEPLGWGWRAIFVVGGALPIAAALLIWLTRSRAAGSPGMSTRPLGDLPEIQSVSRVLFGDGRARTTWMLWSGFFFTQLVLLLMLNWLPSLIVGLGFTGAQASAASMSFNLGGAIGSTVLGRLHAGRRRRLWVVITYAAVVAALIILPAAGRVYWLAAAMGTIAGIFIIGAQLILFAVAPLYYGRANRGAGVGAAVAVGRLGSVVGPLYAGALLSGGGGSARVLLGIVPFVAVAGTAAFALCSRPQCAD